MHVLHIIDNRVTKMHTTDRTCNTVYNTNSTTEQLQHTDGAQDYNLLLTCRLRVKPGSHPTQRAQRSFLCLRCGSCVACVRCVLLCVACVKCSRVLRCVHCFG